MPFHELSFLIQLDMVIPDLITSCNQGNYHLWPCSGSGCPDRLIFRSLSAIMLVFVKPTRYRILCYQYHFQCIEVNIHLCMHLPENELIDKLFILWVDSYVWRRWTALSVVQYILKQKKQTTTCPYCLTCKNWGVVSKLWYTANGIQNMAPKDLRHFPNFHTDLWSRNVHFYSM